MGCFSSLGKSYIYFSVQNREAFFRVAIFYRGEKEKGNHISLGCFRIVNADDCSAYPVVLSRWLAGFSYMICTSCVFAQIRPHCLLFPQTYTSSKPAACIQVVNMMHSFKQFRKRHLSNDPVVTLFPLRPCGKVTTAEETALKLIVRKKDEDKTKIGGDDVLSGTENSDDESVLTRHPMEPNEIDHPIRCPHPEPCIIQDGRALKERAPSIKRRGQLPFLKKEDAQSMRWNRRTAPSDSQIYPTASAPEASFKTILP